MLNRQDIITLERQGNMSQKIHELKPYIFGLYLLNSFPFFFYQWQNLVRSCFGELPFKITELSDNTTLN